MSSFRIGTTLRTPSAGFQFSLAAVLMACLLSLALGLVPGTAAPSILAPMSLPATLVALFLADALPWFVPILLLTALFLYFGRTIHGDPSPPSTRLLWVHRGAGILSAAWFAVGWRLGVQYEGTTFVLATAVLSLCFFLALEWLGTSLRRKSTSTGRLVYVWLLFAWTIAYAFPWLGETF